MCSQSFRTDDVTINICRQAIAIDMLPSPAAGVRRLHTTIQDPRKQILEIDEAGYAHYKEHTRAQAINFFALSLMLLVNIWSVSLRYPNSPLDCIPDDRGNRNILSWY